MVREAPLRLHPVLLQADEYRSANSASDASDDAHQAAAWDAHPALSIAEDADAEKSVCPAQGARVRDAKSLLALVLEPCTPDAGRSAA